MDEAQSTIDTESAVGGGVAMAEDRVQVAASTPSAVDDDDDGGVNDAAMENQDDEEGEDEQGEDRSSAKGQQRDGGGSGGAKVPVVKIPVPSPWDVLCGTSWIHISLWLRLG